MDDGARRHVVPEPLIRSETTPSTTKTRRSRKIHEDDSPMFKLGSSLTPTLTLESPYGLNQMICDPLCVDTPQKSSQKRDGKITPQNNMKIPARLSGETSSPVSIAERSRSTPRKTQRRSTDKLSMTELKAVHRPSISRVKSSKRIPSSKAHDNIKDMMPVNASPQTAKVNKDSPLPKRSRKTKSNAVSTITSDLDLSWFQTNDTVNTGISSEPRYLGKSDFGRFSTRRLSFTPQETVNKQEYDPNEDAFTQSLIYDKFNWKSAKQQIGKLLSTIDIPTMPVKKSSTCKTNAKVSARCETPVSSKKRQSKSRSSLKTMKRTASAPEVRQPLTEETIRAFLRARDIIKKIRSRTNYRQILGIDTAYSPASKINSLSAPSTITSNSESPTRLTNNDSLNHSMDNSLHDDDDYLASSQPFQPLATQGKEQECLFAGVTAYVDVISNNDNLSGGVRSVLVKYGATVALSFRKDVPVTHVVFSNGHVSTYNKAKKRNLPMVSVLWIEACRNAGIIVDVSKYPPHNLERYETPSSVKELKKRRILNITPAGKFSGERNDNIKKDTTGKIVENSFIKKLNKLTTVADGSEISGKGVMEYESDSQKDKTSLTDLNLVKSDGYNLKNGSKKKKNLKRKLLSSSEKYATDINAGSDRNKSTTKNPRKIPKRNVTITN